MFKKKIKVKFFNGSIYPDYELKKITSPFYNMTNTHR